MEHPEVNAEIKRLLEKLAEVGDGYTEQNLTNIQHLFSVSEMTLRVLTVLGLIDGYDEIKGLDETGCLQITKSFVVKMNEGQRQELCLLVNE